MKKEEIFYSEKLRLRYKIKLDPFKKRVVVFEDNVNYSENEMKKLNGFNDDELKYIHNIKNIFEGVIL